jgi:Holliday junction resolvase RusA-like endonuclease
VYGTVDPESLHPITLRGKNRMTVEWIKIPGRPLSAQSKGSKKRHIEVVKRCAEKRFQKPWREPLSVQIFYVIARRPGHLQDLDNLDKLLLDALKTIVYLDDSQIRSKKSERLYCGERAISSAGIMPPASELQITAELKKEECTFIGITDVLL